MRVKVVCLIFLLIAYIPPPLSSVFVKQPDWKEKYSFKIQTV